MFGKNDKWLNISLTNLKNPGEIKKLIKANEERSMRVTQLLVDIRNSLNQSKVEVLKKIELTLK